MIKTFKKFKFCDKLGDIVKKETKDVNLNQILNNANNNYEKKENLENFKNIIQDKATLTTIAGGGNSKEIAKISENEYHVPEKLKKFFSGKDEESNLIQKKIIEDVIKYKVMEDSISPTVEALKNEVPEISEHIKFRDYIKNLINSDKQEEALRKEGLVILKNKLDPFHKYEIDTHHYRKFHDKDYEVDVQEVLTKDLYEKQRVVDDYVEENKKRLNDLIGYYNNQFKFTKYNKYSYLIYQNNYLKSMKKLKMNLLKNISSVSILSLAFYVSNPYLMLLLMPEYFSLLYSFYFMNGVVDQIILLDNKQFVKFRTFNFLGFRKEYPSGSINILKHFYSGKVKNDVINLDDKGFFFTTRLLRRFFGAKNDGNKNSKGGSENLEKNYKNSQNNNKSNTDNFVHFHKIRITGKSFFIPADLSTQHQDTNEELVLNVINNNLKFVMEYDYSSYEDRADTIHNLADQYKKEYARKHGTTYTTKEELLQEEYSDFLPNRDFTDTKYELTLKRPDAVEGTFINNGYR